MRQLRLSSREMATAAALAALMAATRYKHFGAGLGLPDATLAVFFLGGLALGAAWLFVAFLAEAALIDWLAIAAGGTSDWCVTAAYAFLIPTYGCLWAAGAWCARRARGEPRDWARIVGALAASTAAAFFISNASFYAFSGYFDGLAPAEYALRVAKYFPPYAAGAAFYVALALAVAALIERLSHSPTRPAAR